MHRTFCQQRCKRSRVDVVRWVVRVIAAVPIGVVPDRLDEETA
jgi:endogenous inhibitor of DNA gyrase (YacG/DUF329 family)